MREAGSVANKASSAAGMTEGTFFKNFRQNPKVPKNPSDNPTRRPGLGRKFFADNPKVCKKPSDNWLVGERRVVKNRKYFSNRP
jgi:hypothetical protein